MAAPAGALLVAEPALPSERREKQLPPKSYADAVEEEAPPASINTAMDESEKDATKKLGEPNGSSDTKSIHTASVLRIVDTGSELTGTQRERPDLFRQESKHEYSATGLDDAPRIPPRQKHRKTTSRSSNNGFQDKVDTHGKSSITNGVKNSEIEINGNNDNYVFERGNLTTVKHLEDHEKEPRNSKSNSPKREKAKLASGRKAGQRWQTSPIRFAPLNIPLQRRLQTLVVLMHTLSVPLMVSAFCWLCAIPLFWPLLIPYMIYVISSTASTSGTLSHRVQFLRSLPIWSLFASYIYARKTHEIGFNADDRVAQFPMRLHRTQVLPPTRKYIFGYHPHGIISLGAFGAFSTESLGFSQLFPGITNTLLTLDSNFRIPIYRDYLLALGLAAVSKESCENLLSKGGQNGEGMGRAITIVIGGATESLTAVPNKLALVLKRRKGFVKIAIRTGADLVPVLGFGENDLYEQVQANEHPNIHKFQLLVKKLLGWTIPLFHARGVFNYDVGLMPYRRPVNIVVGRPIRVMQATTPSQEEIDKVHKEYIDEVQRIWDEYKDQFAPHRKAELSFVE